MIELVIEIMSRIPFCYLKKENSRYNFVHESTQRNRCTHEMHPQKGLWESIFIARSYVENLGQYYGSGNCLSPKFRLQLRQQSSPSLTSEVLPLSHGVAVSWLLCPHVTFIVVRTSVTFVTRSLPSGLSKLRLSELKAHENTSIVFFSFVVRSPQLILWQLF